MISLTCVLPVLLTMISHSYSLECEVDCPSEDKMVCGFDVLGKVYKMFPGQCAMKAFIECHKVEIVETSISFCIKSHSKKTRRMEESCPVFCPIYYRPVCGASKLRSYVYKTFTNRCQLDMLNCRGDEETSGYTEVPLSFCPKHYMKNIFKDQIIGSNLPQYHDYDNY